MSVMEAETIDKIFEEARKNREWFFENYQNLLEEYPEEFVAIYSQKIIAHDKDLDILRKELPEHIRGKGSLIMYLTKEKVEFILWE